MVIKFAFNYLVITFRDRVLRITRPRESLLMRMRKFEQRLTLLPNSKRTAVTNTLRWKNTRDHNSTEQSFYHLWKHPTKLEPLYFSWTSRRLFLKFTTRDHSHSVFSLFFLSSSILRASYLLSIITLTKALTSLLNASTFSASTYSSNLACGTLGCSSASLSPNPKEEVDMSVWKLDRWRCVKVHRSNSSTDIDVQSACLLICND